MGLTIKFTDAEIKSMGMGNLPHMYDTAGQIKSLKKYLLNAAAMARYLSDVESSVAQYKEHGKAFSKKVTIEELHKILNGTTRDMTVEAFSKTRCIVMFEGIFEEGSTVEPQLFDISIPRGKYMPEIGHHNPLHVYGQERDRVVEGSVICNVGVSVNVNYTTGASTYSLARFKKQG